MLTFPSVSFILFSSFILAFGLDLSENSPCITPNQENAKCIPIFSCPTISQPLIATPNPAKEIIEFAKESQCGYTSQPLVCCGNYNKKVAQKGVITTHYLLPSTCGIQKSDDRIWYGDHATLGEYPWTALLGNNFGNPVEFSCGGSLINERYILTAAHCFRRNEITKVRLGEHFLNQNKDCVRISKNQETCADKVVDVDVEDIIKHPEYRSATGFNDIALVRLAKNVQFTDYVKPICLPLKNTVLENNSKLMITGWGNTERASTSDVKLKARIPVTSNKECKKILDVRLMSNQFCAGGNKQDACHGDSGGPAMRSIKDDSLELIWLLEGIISRGKACGLLNFPAIYTKVSEHIDWILNNLKP